MKTNAEKLMTKLRTDLNNCMESVLSRTKVMRIVKYFPPKGNQQCKKLLCYDEYNGVISKKDVTYITRGEIKNLLPKRLPIIEDNFYIGRKNFDYWD